MSTQNFRPKNITLLVLLIIGLNGTVLFFPINLDNQFTCLFHRLAFPDHDYRHSHDTNDQVLQSKETPSGKYAEQSTSFSTENLHHQYMHTFSYFWWGSLLLVVFSIFALKHQKSISTHFLEQPKLIRPENPDVEIEQNEMD